MQVSAADGLPAPVGCLGAKQSILFTYFNCRYRRLKFNVTNCLFKARCQQKAVTKQSTFSSSW